MSTQYNKLAEFNNRQIETGTNCEIRQHGTDLRRQSQTQLYTKILNKGINITD